MSYLVTARQGGISIEVHDKGKLSLRTLALGDKVVVDKLNSQLERMKASGMLGVRKATPSEQTRYDNVFVG